MITTIKNKPKVSILILTYNRVELSKECIPTIIDRIGNIAAEVLIWDNCSQDGTYDWLQEYSRADCRITKIFTHDSNIGVEGINNLAREATGEYILKIDDDVEPPISFAETMVKAFEQVNEDKLLFLGWDMKWKEKTFATRSGLKLYKDPLGKIVQTDHGKVLINFTPSEWLVNGICRLSLREKFLEIGGHPEGVVYGVDFHISKRAEKHGYWIGYLNTTDLVIHKGTKDTKEYRELKDGYLRQHGSPKDH